MMPPARCTSSMCTSALAGRDLAEAAARARDSRSMSRHGEVDAAPRARRPAGAARCWSSRPWRCRASWRSRTPRSWRSCAAARWRRPARSSGARGRRSGGRPRRNSRLRSAWVASVEPLPGSDRPSASVRQFIELAVNMPEQEPQVGQAERSMAATSSSVTLVVGGRDHGVDQVERDLLALQHDLAGLHRPAGDEHRRDVEAQRRHQHAGRDLVAVGDADHARRRSAR